MTQHGPFRKSVCEGLLALLGQDKVDKTVCWGIKEYKKVLEVRLMPW